MMSAPSSASRIAWLRPWPRAAPVTKATLPSTRPAMVGGSSLGGGYFLLLSRAPSIRGLLLVGEAGVDRHGDPSDVAGVVGDQPQDRVGDVDRLDHADRERVGHGVAQRRVLGQKFL